MTRPAQPRQAKPKGVHKRRTTVEEIVPDTPSEEEELTDFDVALESVEDTEKLREVMESYGETGVSFKIHKQTPTGAPFCYRSEVLDEEFIQTNYGGGDYIAKIYINGKFKRNLTVKIAEKLVSPSLGSGNAADSHSSFLEKLVLAMIAKESHPVSSSEPIKITDLVGALAGIDQLRGKQETGLEMFMKGADFAKGMEGGEESWKSMLMRHAPQLLDGVSTIAGNIMGGKPRPATPPMPITTATTINPEKPSEEQPVQIGEAYFKEGLKYLKGRLIAGMQPDTVINWVFDNRDDPTYQPFLQGILSKPFDYFVSIDAEIGQEPFASAFRYIYDGIRTLFTEEHQMELDSGRDSGDISDPGSNGKAGAGGTK